MELEPELEPELELGLGLEVALLHQMRPFWHLPSFPATSPMPTSR